MIPTKTLKVPVRKSPQGEGKASWENYEMRIHKRMIDLAADERALHLILRVPIPSDINLEIQLLE
jgi:small subunit ribosomal protein S10